MPLQMSVVYKRMCICMYVSVYISILRCRQHTDKPMHPFAYCFCQWQLNDWIELCIRANVYANVPGTGNEDGNGDGNGNGDGDADGNANGDWSGSSVIVNWLLECSEFSGNFSRRQGGAGKVGRSIRQSPQCDLSCVRFEWQSRLFPFRWLHVGKGMLNGRHPHAAMQRMY